MRLRRLRVQNFRAIEDRELRFGDGVTILEGPNESGKTTMIAALDLLLRPDVKDNSNMRDVVQAKPLGRDVVPEVEAELDTGPYHLVVRRRWARTRVRMTELEILAPQRESLTGDEAHDRLHAILDETLDTALFRALRVMQGEALDQPSLARGGWLGHALDDAAGGAGSTPEHEQLFERVRQRYESFFTPKTGKPRREILEARQAVEDASTRLARTEQDLEDLSATIEHHARVATRIAECERKLPALREREERSKALVAELERAVAELDGAQRNVRIKRHELREVELEIQERDARRQTIAQYERALADLKSDLDGAVRDLESAELDAGRTRERLVDGRRETQAARTRLEETRADEQLLLRRERLRDRRADHEQALELTARLAEAEQLAGHPLDEHALTTIQDAARNAEIERAALRREGPRVRLEALDALDLEVGGEPLHLDAGDSRDLAVDDGLSVALPERLLLSVTPGASLDALRDAVHTAEERLRISLDAVGLEDAMAATRLWPRIQAARGNERDLRRQLDRLAGDLPHQEIGVVAALARWLEKEDAALAARMAGRPADAPPPPADAAAAEEAIELAQARCAALEEELQQRVRAKETAEQKLQSAELRELKARTLHDSQQAGLAEAVRELEERRARRSEDELAGQLEAANRALADAERHEQTLRRRTDEDELERRRALLAGDRAGRSNAEGQLGDLQQEIERCEGQLDALGGRGLFERAEAERAERARLAEVLERLERQADAARLLFETLDRHREAARQAYRLPLREQITALGRIAHGRHFDVELDDQLRIHKRIDERGPVPFEQLSSGTKEQLDLIMRAAVARLVAEQGGVPLIVDDALGYADPERLRAMNALLGQVGQSVQIVVLTCHPDRFAAVPGAELVRITRSDGGP